MPKQYPQRLYEKHRLCKITKSCLDGACQNNPSGCTKNTDCQNNQICLDGACQNSIPSGCTKNTDCANNQTCINGACQNNPSGCTKNTDCGNNQTCVNGACQNNPTCQNECSENQKRCSGNGFQVCRKLSSGCTQWGAAENCPPKQACQNGSCVTICRDTCSSVGASSCVGNSGFKVCSVGTMGCLEWGATQNCGGGQSCNNGSCAVVKSQEGEACVATADCSSGLVCSADVNKQSRCRRFCSRSTDCTAGQACYETQGGSKICFPTSGVFPPFDAKCGVLVKNAQITGGSWDPLGGAPDPLVQIDFANGKMFRTQYISDSFSPTWNESSASDFSYKDIYGMIVSMRDSDFDGDQVMVAWDAVGGRWNMTQPRSQDFRLTTTDNSIILTVQVNCNW